MPPTFPLRWTLAAVMAGATAISLAQSGTPSSGRPASDAAAGPAGLGADRSDKLNSGKGDNGATSGSGSKSSNQ